MTLIPISPKRTSRLDDVSAAKPDALADEETLAKQTRKAVERIAKRQRLLYADGRHALLVLFQGRSASGKDGVIRNVFSGVNPAGCAAWRFQTPTRQEAAHDFLWRAHQRVPPRGMIGVFNRSYYEEVLAARVDGLVDRRTLRRARGRLWAARFEQINEFERMLTAEGVTIVKFLLHVSRAEQGRRLERRTTDPKKHWKFDPTDLEERARWSEYTRAYRDVLRRTSTVYAPWYVVPADDKPARDWLVASTVAGLLAELPLRYPPAEPGVKGAVIP